MTEAELQARLEVVDRMDADGLTVAIVVLHTMKDQFAPAVYRAMLRHLAIKLTNRLLREEP